MSSSTVITVVVLAAVAWLVFLGVSALRSRGREGLPANLAPGTTDEELETRWLERVQQASVLLSAFLAVSLPIYYLTEQNRQEAFVEQFEEESLERGAHYVVEFQCWNCHGPDGVGGVASYVEKRSGVTVAWAAPSLNDVFYRYGTAQVDYWITYGRANSPMPPWGLEGGGPMNRQQVEDIVRYLESIQISQDQVAANVETTVTARLQDLEAADAAMESAILSQRQVVAELRRAPELTGPGRDLADRARGLLNQAGEGIDTDGDGLSDVAEAGLVALTREAKQTFLLTELRDLEGLAFAPDNPATNQGRPDREVAEEAAEVLRGLADAELAPAIVVQAAAIEAALAAGGDDADGDGVSDTAEAQISGQIAAAIGEVLPSELRVLTLDPQNAESAAGQPDQSTAAQAVSGLETIALNLGIQGENLDRLLPPAEQALENLLRQQRERNWEFDLAAIADTTFGGDLASATRVVGLYQGFCARCHTSGWSAGLPLAQPAGSGGFGPALWQGRPAVQFLSEDDLVAFLTVGAEANKAYGVNGFGSGRMPGFGKILSEEDLRTLARWLRAGDLTGRGD